MKNTYVIVLSLLVAISLLTAWKQLSDKKRTQQQRDQYMTWSSALSGAYAETIYSDSRSHTLRNVKVVNERLDTLTLQEVFRTGKVKLAVRIREDLCSECIENMFAQIRKLARTTDTSRIVLLTSYRNITEIIKYREIKQVPVSIYNSLEYGFDAAFEEVGMPFLFLSDSTLHMNAVFVDRERNGAAEKFYIETVKNVLQLP